MMEVMNDPQNEQQQYEQEQEEDYIPPDFKVGSIEFRGIGAGADVWAYWHVASNRLMLHFAGYKLAGAASWNLHVPLEIPVRDTFRMCAGMAYDHAQPPGPYLQIPELDYTVDGEVYEATVNERMDFPDETWENLRNEGVYGLRLMLEFA
jgi:hypothetical protein